MESVNNDNLNAFLDFTGALDIQFRTVPVPDFNLEVNITDKDLAGVIRQLNHLSTWR